MNIRDSQNFVMELWVSASNKISYIGQFTHSTIITKYTSIFIKHTKFTMLKTYIDVLRSIITTYYQINSVYFHIHYSGYSSHNNRHSDFKVLTVWLQFLYMPIGYTAHVNFLGQYFPIILYFFLFISFHTIFP